MGNDEKNSSHDSHKPQDSHIERSQQSSKIVRLLAGRFGLQFREGKGKIGVRLALRLNQGADRSVSTNLSHHGAMQYGPSASPSGLPSPHSTQSRKTHSLREPLALAQHEGTLTWTLSILQHGQEVHDIKKIPSNLLCVFPEHHRRRFVGVKKKVRKKPKKTKKTKA